MTMRLTRQREDVRGSGIYPATGPYPPGHAKVVTPAELGHPERHVESQAGPGLEDAALLLGRAIFGGYFLFSGIHHFVDREMMAGYARSKGVPAADLAVLASGAMIVAGGLSLLTGTQPKAGAGLIAAFLLGVSPQMHAFWKETDQQQRMNEMINFTKNMALVGAALIAASHAEPWPYSVGMKSGGALAAV
jgi:putative oxidoreductase